MGSTFDSTLSSTSASPDVVPSALVVPLDGSDLSLRAAPVAEWFAERFNAEVLAVTASTTRDGHDRAVRPAWLEELAADGRYPRLRASVADDADPVSAVAALVAKHPNSAVCMGTHSHGAVTAAALGSVAERVVREVGVPVLLVGRGCSQTRVDQGPIVVCHDGSPAADAILAPARAWARSLNAPIVLMRAHPANDFRAAQEPADAIGRALEFLGPGTCLEEVVNSFAAGAIRELAHELDASLIAMSTHGRSALARVVMGKSAAWVTRESPCPVLTIRPDHLVR